jgi:hypothetical protein
LELFSSLVAFHGLWLLCLDFSDGRTLSTTIHLPKRSSIVLKRTAMIYCPKKLNRIVKGKQFGRHSVTTRPEQLCQSYSEAGLNGND